jgi:plasmid stability protein
MVSVLIRDIPEKIVNRLKRIARKNNRSLQQELRAVLENTVSQSSPDVFQRVAEIKGKLRKKGVRFTDSVKILRMDRAR